MNNILKQNIILAFETGIDCGSISIFEGEKKIESRQQIGGLSKTEELITVISEMFEANKISKKEISKIIYSDGPGGLTGLRIGKATAKGLALSLNCQLKGISFIYALSTIGLDKKSFTVSVMGKGKVIYQDFQRLKKKTIKTLSEPKELNLDEFVSKQFDRLILWGDFYDNFEKINNKMRIVKVPKDEIISDLLIRADSCEFIESKNIS